MTLPPPGRRANAKDDEVDDDGDGVADVDQLTPPQLLQRKAFLLMCNPVARTVYNPTSAHGPVCFLHECSTTVKEPQKIQAAVGSVYAALLAVLATLKLEFAATTAMAMGVADMCKKPLFKFVVPGLEKVLPPQMHQWIRPTIDSTMRIVAIAVAWYVQQLISAFYSALRGGKLFASGLFNIIADKAKKGLVLCPGVIGADFNPDESILDELIGWILAFQVPRPHFRFRTPFPWHIPSFLMHRPTVLLRHQGFMFQLNTGFALPFPWNIVFAPLTLLEWYLRLQISSEVISGGDGSHRLLQGSAMDISTCSTCCFTAGWTYQHANATPSATSSL